MFEKLRSDTILTYLCYVVKSFPRHSAQEPFPTVTNRSMLASSSKRLT